MRKTVILFLPKVCYGGQERVVSRLIDIINDSIDVYLTVFDDSEVVYEINAPIIAIGNRNLDKPGRFRKAMGLLQASRALSKIVKEKEAIVCISFGRQVDIVNIISKMYGGKAKHIVSIRGYATAKYIVNSRIRSWLYSRSDCIISVSKAIQELLRDRLPISKDRIVTIYNPYDGKNIYNLSKPDGSLDKDTFTIVSVGTLKWEKGYWHLLKAFKIAQQKTEKAVRLSLQVIGDDYNNNKNKLIKLADDLGISDFVEFVEWQSNPYRYIGKADLFVLPSVSEGFPNALVEAMACGRAVIAADCKTGPKEILAENDIKVDAVSKVDYGVLVPELNIREDYSVNIDAGDEALAEAIVMLVTNNEERIRYEELSRKRADDFSYSRCKEEYLNLLGVGQ
jgi:Glycosyltransferase